MSKIKKENATAIKKTDEIIHASIDPANLELFIDAIYPVFKEKVDFETIQKIDNFRASKL